MIVLTFDECEKLYLKHILRKEFKNNATRRTIQSGSTLSQQQSIVAIGTAHT